MTLPYFNFYWSDAVAPFFFSLLLSSSAATIWGRLLLECGVYFFGKLTDINNCRIRYIRAIQRRLLDAVSSWCWRTWTWFTQTASLDKTHLVDTAGWALDLPYSQSILVLQILHIIKYHSRLSKAHLVVSAEWVLFQTSHHGLLV